MADRIKAVFSLNSGHEYSQVAAILLLDEVTLRRYVEKLQEKGIDGLLEYRYTGGKSQLTTLQIQELKVFLVENTQTKAKDIVSHIKKQYGISYSVIGVTKFLHRLGFSYKKPKIIPGKAERNKQEAFIKEYQRIKSHLGKNDQIYFLDSTHPTHNTTASYGWILKGKENDTFIKTNTGRSRLNLNGALNLGNHTAIVLEEKTIDYKATIKLFKKLLTEHPAGKIHLILDNASHHHHHALKPFLKKHRRLKTVFLPTYSPNLNLIERLWRFFHQKVTNNHYFETFEEFRRTSLRFFKNLGSYKEELRTLMTDNFQLVPNLKLQT